MEADFSGYATKSDIRCTDGLVIKPNAFQHQDGMKVPLVWQHGHDNPENILGHAILENREDGVYVYAYLNSTPAAQAAKEQVLHGDINSMSIYANRLRKNGDEVIHGNLIEVSLVLAGANPGALIDFVNIVHGDQFAGISEDEAVITTGLNLALQHAEGDGEEPSDEDKAKAVQAVFDSLNDEQRQLVFALVGATAEGDAETDEAQQSDNNNDSEDDSLQHDQEENDMGRNVFDQNDVEDKKTGATLTHSQLQTIVEDAKRLGSFKESFLKHAGTFGIDNIDILFPDAQKIHNSPDFVKRQTDWVAGVFNGAHHSPFSRIKSISADITADEARAKGYIKGNQKTEEVFGLLKRVTTPQTVYKKQKLDRDDIIDITDLDVVAWLKAEMRLMLEEELAAAVLVGDGRAVDNPDKIKNPTGEDGAGIRAIATDADLYTIKVDLDTAATNYTPNDFIDTVLMSMEDYEGSGNTTLYASPATIIGMLLQRDSLGRRIYATEAELASAMGVGRIQRVPASILERSEGVHAIIVDIKDYTIGADKGGALSMFDDFDIDYNQYKYLLETRVSGALKLPKSAIVVRQPAAAGA